MEFFPQHSVVWRGYAEYTVQLNQASSWYGFRGGDDCGFVSIGSDKAGSVVVDPALSLPVFPHLTPHGYMKKSETLNAT